MPDFDFPFEERLSSAATLPSWCYTRADVLEKEEERVFGRTWQLVGREDQAAAPGRFFTAEVAGEPLLITRGADSRLRALSNVCRHRAGPVAAGEGTCQAFRCGYHGWSYGLDGRLVNTPEFDAVEDFRKEEHGLPEFPLEAWLGLLFVNLDPPPGAPALRQTLEDLPARLAARGLEAIRPAARKEWTVEFSDEIQFQDIAICEAVQKGLQSRTYDRGRFSVRRENGVHHFHSLLARALRGD